MQSYKCGRNTAIKFCKNADEFKCDQFKYGEAGAGGSESQDIGVHDSHTSIRLTPYDPTVKHAATVYSMDYCHGHSSIVWIEEGLGDSGDLYANIHEALTTTPDFEEFWKEDPGVKSVLLPQGLGYWMETYENPNFEGYKMYVDGSADDWTRCKNF